jgi:hypothetical protein
MVSICKRSAGNHQTGSPPLIDPFSTHVCFSKAYLYTRTIQIDTQAGIKTRHHTSGKPRQKVRQPGHRALSVPPRNQTWLCDALKPIPSLRVQVGDHLVVPATPTL